jgi:hypothetical protein
MLQVREDAFALHRARRGGQQIGSGLGRFHIIPFAFDLARVAMLRTAYDAVSGL